MRKGDPGDGNSVIEGTRWLVRRCGGVCGECGDDEGIARLKETLRGVAEKGGGRVKGVALRRALLGTNSAAYGLRLRGEGVG